MNALWNSLGMTTYTLEILLVFFALKPTAKKVFNNEIDFSYIRLSET
jgi:hypothetical protein